MSDESLDLFEAEAREAMLEAGLQGDEADRMLEDMFLPAYA